MEFCDRKLEVTAIEHKLFEDRFTLAMPCADHVDGLDRLLNDPAIVAWLGGPRSR